MSNQLAWFKSSYSDDEGGNCVEIATRPHTIHIRDSKLGEASPTFTVQATAWARFTAELRDSGSERLF
ncbi:DUF397 domain-containing protein [Streptomyces sp. NPDC055189]